MRWLGLIVVPLVALASFLVMHAGASDHPLATQASPSVCSALRSGPSGGVPVSVATAASPLGEHVGQLPVCDIPALRGLVSVAVVSRRRLAGAEGDGDTAAYVAGRLATVTSAGAQPVAQPGPWREAWVYQLPGDDRRHLLAEDNGIAIEAATRADGETLVESARRASEAFRAVLP